MKPFGSFQLRSLKVSVWTKSCITPMMKWYSWLHVITGALCTLLVCYILHIYASLPLRSIQCKADLWATALDTGFEGFDNVTGQLNGSPIIPNYVHFLRYGGNLKDVNFMDAVNILAAFKNQKPDKIMFHTNLGSFGGKFWDRLLQIPKFNETIELHPIELIDSVFGQPLDVWNGLWHASDVLRIQILQKYGGIFIDNDVYIVQNMDRYRRYEMVLENVDELNYGTMTLVAHKDARFLQLWLDEYKEYYPHYWYYNAGIKAKLNVIDVRPELVHDAQGSFGVEDLREELYIQNWKKWKSKYTIHLLVRHTHSCPLLTKNKLGLKYPVTFTQENILQYNVTILEMVLDCCKELLHVE